MSKKRMLLFVLFVISLTYLGGVKVYKKRALPRTYINNEKVSGLTLNRINEKFIKQDDWKGIDIKINDDVLLTISNDDINYEYYGNTKINEIVNENSWLWFAEFAKRKDHELDIIYLFNYDKLKNIVKNNKSFQQEKQNAELIYSEEDNKYVIKPHICSVSLDVENIAQQTINNIQAKKNELNLNQYVICPEILSNDENLLKAQKEANEFINVVLTYNFGNRKEKDVVDKTLIKEWISFKNNELTFDKELMREYIITLSQKYDTFGKPRDFKTTSGEIIKTSGGSYGWLIHRSNSVDKLIKDIKAGENKVVEPVYSYSAISRNQDDIGNSYVEIDIKNQMVYVYSEGELKVSTPTVTGNISKGHDTPLGVDPLNYKTTNAILRGPGYASPVKYWMPFNGGVGLHDADWRTEFGGEIYKTKGSHGCINLPPAIAREVYDLVFPGMPVIVY